ncbi:hypothetical protein KS4_09300 [Poriferisphaera corsica]|uniref:Uncharacterized protein n=1 Tax=Poriferisphaera corsica TaxID=2528020 RepID=A0A517YRP4_9BACT|nr:hypothetical protein KS4_09300 [Poriferisphaera corsica]
MKQDRKDKYDKGANGFFNIVGRVVYGVWRVSIQVILPGIMIDSEDESAAEETNAAD